MRVRSLLSPVFRSYAVQASVVDDGEKVRRADPYEWGLHSRSRFSQHDRAACVSPSDFIRVSSVQTMAQLYKGPTQSA